MPQSQRRGAPAQPIPGSNSRIITANSAKLCLLIIETLKCRCRRIFAMDPNQGAIFTVSSSGFPTTTVDVGSGLRVSCGSLVVYF